MQRGFAPVLGPAVLFYARCTSSRQCHGRWRYMQLHASAAGWCYITYLSLGAPNFWAAWGFSVYCLRCGWSLQGCTNSVAGGGGFSLSCGTCLCLLVDGYAELSSVNWSSCKCYLLGRPMGTHRVAVMAVSSLSVPSWCCAGGGTHTKAVPQYHVQCCRSLPWWHLSTPLHNLSGALAVASYWLVHPAAV